MDKLSETVASLAMERVAALLADRVADRVGEALMNAAFDKQFASSLLQALEKQVKETEGGHR